MVFEANVRDIEAINSHLSYMLGVNEFSDFTTGESMSVLRGSPTPSDEDDEKKRKNKYFLSV